MIVPRAKAHQWLLGQLLHSLRRHSVRDQCRGKVLSLIRQLGIWKLPLGRFKHPHFRLVKKQEMLDRVDLPLHTRVVLVPPQRAEVSLAILQALRVRAP